MKKLNDKELAMLERNSSNHRIACQDIDIQKKNIEILMLKKKFMDVDIGLAQQRIENLKRFEQTALEVKKDFVKTMEKKHKISGRWGYCPDSGEIKEDEDNGN